MLHEGHEGWSSVGFKREDVVLFVMRRKEPLDVNKTWEYPVPMPMPGRPVCCTEDEATNQLEKIGFSERIFLWTDDERRIISDWGYLASVRQGVPPKGIEAELNAWLNQYPTAWLAVDLRDGVIPPSTQTPLNTLLENTKRNVLIIVSSSSDHEEWPQWKLPF